MAPSQSGETNFHGPCGSNRTAALVDQKSVAQPRADSTLGAKCGMQVEVRDAMQRGVCARQYLALRHEIFTPN
jgi:hypothetical protein